MISSTIFQYSHLTNTVTHILHTFDQTNDEQISFIIRSMIEDWNKKKCYSQILSNFVTWSQSVTIQLY